MIIGQQEHNPYPLSPSEEQYIACFGMVKFMEMKNQSSNKEKLDRLRDEFAIEMAGKLLMKLNFTGSFPNVNNCYRVLMEDAYSLADAALKAREQSK